MKFEFWVQFTLYKALYILAALYIFTLVILKLVVNENKHNNCFPMASQSYFEKMRKTAVRSVH